MENGLQLPAQSSHVKVLVVDDHPNTASMLARVLSRLGEHLEVSSATSGKDALQQIEANPTDILITDMIMPGMTGLELIEKLSATSVKPVISFLMTAYDVPGLRMTSRRLKVKDVLTKPVPPEQIVQIITEAMKEITQENSPSLETVEEQPVMADAPEKLSDLVIDNLLWETANEFQTQAKEKDLLLVIGKTEPDRKVRGDVGDLRRAVHELARIAVQTTAQGGTITFSMVVETGVVNIHVLSSGISASMPGLFKSLVGYLLPTDEGHDEKPYDQQAVSMNIVKTIAKLHGGDVKAEENGKGLCFILSLPLYNKDEVPQTEQQDTTLE